MDSRIIRVTHIARRVGVALAALEDADRLMTEAVIAGNDDLAYASWDAGRATRALLDALTSASGELKLNGQRGTDPAH